MGLILQGLGVATPAGSIAQGDAAQLAADRAGVDRPERRLLARLYHASGVARRHSVLAGPMPDASPPGPPPQADAPADPAPPCDGIDRFFPVSTNGHARGPTTAQRMARYDADAPALAEAAVRAALADARVGPGRITQLVTVSCTGFASPGVDLALIHRLGLPLGVGRTHIGFMGCHGALNGLRVAGALARADPKGCVLLVCVELCSLHFQYGPGSRQAVANALFGDGAAAIVGRAQPTAPRPGPRPAPTDPWAVAAHASAVLPDSVEDMSWRIDDHGFVMTLSPRVPRQIARALPTWLIGVLAEHGLGVSDIGSWAVHPGGPRVLGAVTDALGLPPGAVGVSRGVLADHGNMSSPTVLFILDRLRRAAAPRPCVALAFGPGLTAEMALLR